MMSLQKKKEERRKKIERNVGTWRAMSAKKKKKEERRKKKKKEERRKEEIARMDYRWLVWRGYYSGITISLVCEIDGEAELKAPRIDRVVGHREIIF